MAKTLWILSEERPKLHVIAQILQRFADSKKSVSPDALRLLPLSSDGERFSFWYEIQGFRSSAVKDVRLRLVRGASSFVDYLVFLQTEPPSEGDQPLLLIEETKTDDEESRNTGVYQRVSKFVFADLHFPTTPKVMLYNLGVPQRENQTATNLFGMRSFATLGVAVEGKSVDSHENRPFESLDEMIDLKSKMRRPPAGNVPIDISRAKGALFISGRLFKSGGLSHDPNIGALSMIAATARHLDWKKRIVITQHGLSQKHVDGSNKFVKIALALGIEIDGLTLPKAQPLGPYWQYEQKGEKLASIFLHLAIETFTKGSAIFENHAGCEKGYFITSDHANLQLEKYVPNSSPRRSISIPDLIIKDPKRKTILNLEGKKTQNLRAGIAALETYEDIEKLYIQRHYPSFKVERSVVLYGGTSSALRHKAVSFLLTVHGDLIAADKNADLVRESIAQVKDHWRKSAP